MWRRALSVVFVGILCGSLFAIDHLLGNGLMDLVQNIFCKCFCFVKRTLKNQMQSSESTESNKFNFPVFMVEIIALFCTMLLLNRYKRYSLERSCKEKDPNELLDIKRRRRVSRAMEFSPQEINNPQLIQPFNLEMPVLHMAIIDTIGTTRSQPERGDAGDIYNITDSAILSVTSLLDKDFKLQESSLEDSLVLGDMNTVQLNNNRYLWNVIEQE